MRQSLIHPTTIVVSIVVIPRLWIRVTLVIFDLYPIPCTNFCLRVWTLKQTQKVWPEKLPGLDIPPGFFPGRGPGQCLSPFPSFLFLWWCCNGFALQFHVFGWSLMGLLHYTSVHYTSTSILGLQMANLVIHNRQSHKAILNTNDVHGIGSVHNRSSCPRCGLGSNILFWLWIWSLDQRQTLYRHSLMPLGYL